ncbi:MAG: flagellar filament outer layer protein FlaA [Brevinema sp.]
MGKKLNLFFVALLFCTPLAFSQEKTHMFFDFSTFEDGIQEIYTNQNNTFINENGRVYAEIGSRMFMLSNWLVTVSNRDGENPLDNKDSYSRRIQSGEQGTVLGVRIKFPEWPFPDEAIVRPTFPLLPFNYAGEYANINNGVVTNVGIIKSFSQWVNGRAFPHTLAVRMLDDSNQIKEIPLGSLRFLGWRRLSYNNPFFPQRPEDMILPLRPIYPHTLPLLRFDSFIITRPSNAPVGDFIAYIGNSEITYSPYYVEDNLDIDDELEWGLHRQKQEDSAVIGNRVLYDKIVQYEYARKRWEYTQNLGRPSPQ